MVTSQETLDRIKEIIDKGYQRLTLSILSESLLTPEQLAKLKASGVYIANNESKLAQIYYHNFINSPINNASPKNISEMRIQQNLPGIKPAGEAHDFAVDTLNQSTKQYIEKLRLETATRIEGLIRQNNTNYKMDALQNLDRSYEADQLVKQISLNKVKQQLKDTSGDGNRDWQRVALTEMSNAIGAGSVDRIVVDNANNENKELSEVYVYRIIVGDALTCKFCRRFYGDVGESPKIYKLSTLLSNGSNYGLKTDQWKPVIGATHPNTRTSQILELKPGFKVNAGGTNSYIGLEKWKQYILDNLVA